MTTQEFKIEGYTLTVIPDEGFYLTDDIGCVVIDASILDSNWPIEISTVDKFYLRVDTTGADVEFGVSKRTQ